MLSKKCFKSVQSLTPKTAVKRLNDRYKSTSRKSLTNSTTWGHSLSVYVCITYRTTEWRRLVSSDDR